MCQENQQSHLLPVEGRTWHSQGKGETLGPSPLGNLGGQRDSESCHSESSP